MHWPPTIRANLNLSIGNASGGITITYFLKFFLACRDRLVWSVTVYFIFLSCATKNKPSFWWGKKKIKTHGFDVICPGIGIGYKVYDLQHPAWICPGTGHAMPLTRIQACIIGYCPGKNLTVVPYCYLFLMSVFNVPITWVTYLLSLGSWINTSVWERDVHSVDRACLS